MNRISAEKYLIDIANKENAKYYEIVEDSYVYPHGLLLIVYSDELFENEIFHICVNIDDF